MSIAGHAGGTQVTMFVHQASGHTVVNHIVDTEDLFVLLSSFAPHTKASLNELSKIMGMPGKPEGIDGAEVEPYFLAGKIKEIADYCETDVVNTYRVWLKYELFRGRLSEGDHQASERSLADFIAARVNTKVHLTRMVQERSA
jgi:3'-5' exonuclease